MEENEFELKIRISPSDKDFKKLIGDEAFLKIQKETFSRDRDTCRGCGYHPINDREVSLYLSCHVEKINESALIDSPCLALCRTCHFIQHIDTSIEKGWIKLVNSTFSQKRLVEMCRVGGVINSIKDDNTRTLKITPLEYLEKMKAGTLPINTKAKAIFTDKFQFQV